MSYAGLYDLEFGAPEGAPDLQPGDRVTTGPSKTPCFVVIAVAGGRAWVRDEATGVDGVVQVERLRLA